MGRHMHATLPLLPLLLLCCTSGCIALTVQHRCIFDVVAHHVRPPGVTISASRAAHVVPAEAALKPGEASGASKPPTPLVEEGWAPIRIRVFTEDLAKTDRFCTREDVNVTVFNGRALPCKREDILTAEKNATLVDKILPAAVKLHADRLFVQTMTTPVIVPRFSQGGICHRFTVPDEHHRKGVSDADMVLYVSAEPTLGNTFAWGVACATLGRSGRPVVGAINYAPRFIELTPQRIRVAAHEMAHALGFSVENMQRHHMTKLVNGTRGKGSDYVVGSSTTLWKTQLHYNCSTLKGMELQSAVALPKQGRREGQANASTPPSPNPAVAAQAAEAGAAAGDNQVVEEERTPRLTLMVTSHWSRRNAKDELMAGLVGAGYYTAITLAAFNDLRYYRVNFSMAEPMSWGRNASCDFLEKKCVVNNSTEFPDMFCVESDASQMRCTSDRQALGTCAMRKLAGDIPAPFQYFSDAKQGSWPGALMEYCPFIVAGAKTGCMDGDESAMSGSRTGPTSRCVKGVNLKVNGTAIGDVCVDVQCTNGVVSVRHKGSEEWKACAEGNTLTVTGLLQGTIVCPRYGDVCTAVLPPALAAAGNANDVGTNDTPVKSDEEALAAAGSTNDVGAKDTPVRSDEEALAAAGSTNDVGANDTPVKSDEEALAAAGSAQGNATSTVGKQTGDGAAAATITAPLAVLAVAFPAILAL